MPNKTGNRHYKNAIAFLLSIFLHGCVTTNLLKITKDKTGGYSDVVTGVIYAKRAGDTLSICVDATTNYLKNTGSGYTQVNQTYSLSILENDLDTINKNASSFVVRRQNIEQCHNDKESIPENDIKVTILTRDEFNNLHEPIPDNKAFSRIALDKIKLIAMPGELVFKEDTETYTKGNAQLYYLNHNYQLILIVAEPPITKGQRSAYLLLPVTLTLDLVTFPLQFLYVMGLAAH